MIYLTEYSNDSSNTYNNNTNYTTPGLITELALPVKTAVYALIVVVVVVTAAAVLVAVLLLLVVVVVFVVEDVL